MDPMNTPAPTDAETGFSLFGFGRDGIPGMFHRQLSRPGEGERLARLVVDGENGRMVAPDFLRTVAQLLVEYYGRRGPLPSFVMEANAAALRLMSPDTGEPLPAPGVRELMGLPKGVDLRRFLFCVGCDATALALHHLPAKGDDAIPVEALHAHVASIKRGEDWAMSGRAILGDSRATMRLLRGKPEYRRIAAEVGGWLLLEMCCQGTRPAARMSTKAIRDTVTAMSKSTVIDMVDRTWTPPPRHSAGKSLLDLGD